MSFQCILDYLQSEDYLMALSALSSSQPQSEDHAKVTPALQPLTNIGPPFVPHPFTNVEATPAGHPPPTHVGPPPAPQPPTNIVSPPVLHLLTNVELIIASHPPSNIRPLLVAHPLADMVEHTKTTHYTI